jgi:hypothetical protein
MSRRSAGLVAVGAVGLALPAVGPDATGVAGTDDWAGVATADGVRLAEPEVGAELGAAADTVGLGFELEQPASSTSASGTTIARARTLTADRCDARGTAPRRERDMFISKAGRAVTAAGG